MHGIYQAMAYQRNYRTNRLRSTIKNALYRKKTTVCQNPLTHRSLIVSIFAAGKQLMRP